MTMRFGVTKEEAIALRQQYEREDRDLTWADRILPYRRTWGDISRWMRGAR